jgi:hypothetical protein
MEMIKKRILIIALISILSNNYSLFSQPNITQKKWKNVYFAMVQNQDTTVIYDKWRVVNFKNFSKIGLFLKTDNTYFGSSIDGQGFKGSWELTNNKLISDNDTCEVISISNDTLYTKGHYIGFNTDGSRFRGTILVKYANDISEIYSISDGLWNNPQTWSCNCIPTPIDNVRIKFNHTVTQNQNDSKAKCWQLFIELGAKLDCKGKISISSQ